MPQGKELARTSRTNGTSGGNKTMAEKLGLEPGIKELHMGRSFTSREPSFHTLRYDFKPASVDVTKASTVAVEDSQKVTVTVPHVDGAGTQQTVYKGSHRPYQKECVLIIDKKTGKITLEKLKSNLQLKKTRSESDGFNKRSSLLRAQQMASSLSTVIPRHSPLHPSPSHHSRSPTQQQNQFPSTAGSLPMIGIDDTPYNSVGASCSSSQVDNSGQQSLPSLSESSSDSSPCPSDTEVEQKPAKSTPPPFNNNYNTNGQYSTFSNLLTEDLQLSESGSDD